MIMAGALRWYSSMLFMLMMIYISFFVEIKSHALTHKLDISQHDDYLRARRNCIKSPTTNAANTLEVVHRESLCDYQTQNHPAASSSSSLAEEILRRDQLRVKSIHHKINTNAAVYDVSVTKLQNVDNHADLPVQSGLPLDTGNYIVSIGLGTPTKNLHLVFDTGSDVTWTQCQPCLEDCYNQQDPIFDPHNSTSYSNISCSAAECRAQSEFACYHRATCVYIIRYGDQSYTNGFLAKDKLTVTGNDVFPDFIFGCGQNNSGLFGETAGLLGLGRGKLSFVSQTAQKYGQYFSHRLPPTPNSTGHLSFGKNNMNSEGVKFTPLIDVPQYPGFYCIHIISITVGDIRLRIGSSVFKRDSTIIDSGTVITRLPRKAYITMREEFKRQMNTKLYPRAPAVSILDTCYNVPKGTNITFPSISFTFEGNVTVDLDRSGTVYVLDPTLVCLAFAGNTDPKNDFTIFGNTQQRNLEVVYDVAGGKLGFGR